MIDYNSNKTSAAFDNANINRYIQVWLNPSLNPSNYPVMPVKGKNLMLSAKAIQSSSPYGAQGAADKAIDGIKNCSWNFAGGYNSVTHTSTENMPYWQADLGSSQYIDNIMIYNREDCCKERLANYKVFVSNDPKIANLTSAYQCGTIHDGPGQVKCNYSGRYVTIQIQGSGILSLCEVEAYSS